MTNQTHFLKNKQTLFLSLLLDLLLSNHHLCSQPPLLLTHYPYSKALPLLLLLTLSILKSFMSANQVAMLVH